LLPRPGYQRPANLLREYMAIRVGANFCAAVLRRRRMNECVSDLTRLMLKRWCHQPSASGSKVAANVRGTKAVVPSLGRHANLSASARNSAMRQIVGINVVQYQPPASTQVRIKKIVV